MNNRECPEIKTEKLDLNLIFMPIFFSWVSHRRKLTNHPIIINEKINGKNSILNFASFSRIMSESDNIKKIEYRPIVEIIIKIILFSNFK